MQEKSVVEASQQGARNEIVVYQPNETIRLEVMVENDMVWLNRQQLAQLFGRDVKTIGKHIANALKEELAPTGVRAATVQKAGENRVVAKFATTAADGKTYQVEYYNLEMITSVGYRVKSTEGILFRRWANQVLKEYLLRGIVARNMQSSLAVEMDRRFANHEQRLAMVEEKVDFFVRTSQPPVQGVFYEGQVFDARVFATKHILSAKKSILLIDNWVDMTTLEILSKKAKGVSVEIVTSSKGNKLKPSDIQLFNEQHGGLKVQTSACFHDRFLIIDDKRLYLIGASLKDLGKKCFAFAQLDAGEIPGLKNRCV